MSARAKIVMGVIILAGALAQPAEARRHHGGWHENAENRRDARRAAVVTGLAAGAIAGSAGRSSAERHYEECLYANGYDYECERRRYEDERRARRASRRSATAAGVVAYSIVRD